MKRNKLSVFISAAFLMSVAGAGLASAETFAVAGGTITATKTKDGNVAIVTDIPAITLVHFQDQGIKPIAMNGGAGVLENVAENGSRFQLKDANGKWLLITPSHNSFKMVGVVLECRKSKGGCALEAKI